MDIFNVISMKGSQIEEICRKIELPVNIIFSKLTMLEIIGVISKKDGKFYKVLL